jgi:hypothetical protein
MNFSSTSSNEEAKTYQRQKMLFKILGWLPLIGIFMVMFCSIYIFRYHFTNGNDATVNSVIFISTIGYGALIAGAAYAVGGFGGFLFGLPRSLSNPDGTNKNYSRNDNLIQISDWLTKIIVGLGLTNLHKIPPMLDGLGQNVKVVFGGEQAGAIIGEGLIIYFLVCGFLLGYLWTNIHYIPILTLMDKEAKNITDQKKIQDKETAANAANDVHTESINSSDPNAFIKIEDKQKTISGKTNILSPEDYAARIGKARQKMQKGLQSQSSLPDNLKDPNKNQWGGKSENNGRKLSAIVSSVDDTGLYRVILTVTSFNPAGKMNDGDVVLFVLHNTFPDPYRISLVESGKAELEIISYGAFTVGALADDGVTELEFDLAALKDAPDKFIKN